MPVFVEDPAQLSKLRLKSELVAHNVTLPVPESKKDVYIDLYLKHIGQKNAADFSSDEEDQVQDVGEEEEEEEDPEMLDPSGLTDEALKAELLKHGVSAGPIVASTRALYERKLQRLLQPAVNSAGDLNGTEDTGQYSDSEEEEDREEENESGSQHTGPETVSHLDQNQQEDDQKPVPDVLMEMFPDTERTPTGIVATRRRPITGAAGRPVQFKYLDIPVTPTTPEKRQELERRLVPLWVQVVVFITIVCLLYLIYACVEGSSDNPFVSILESLSLEGAEEELVLQPEPTDTPVLDPLTGQEA